jgi:hypothetical protein
MATTSSLKGTVGSVLGTVTTAAQSISSVFDAVSGGIGMANTYVQNAAERQATQIDYEMADFEAHVHSTVAVERTRNNREIARFLDEDPANREEFEAIYEDLASKVSARREARAKAAGFAPRR